MNDAGEYAVTNGVATATITAPTTDAGQTVSVFADNLMSAATGAGGTAGQSQVANINYSHATAAVSAAAPSATGILLMATPNNLLTDANATSTVWYAGP